METERRNQGIDDTHGQVLVYKYDIFDRRACSALLCFALLLSNKNKSKSYRCWGSVHLAEDQINCLCIAELCFVHDLHILY